MHKPKPLARSAASGCSGGGRRASSTYCCRETMSRKMPNGGQNEARIRKPIRPSTRIPEHREHSAARNHMLIRHRPFAAPPWMKTSYEGGDLRNVRPIFFLGRHPPPADPPWMKLARRCGGDSIVEPSASRSVFLWCGSPFSQFDPGYLEHPHWSHGTVTSRSTLCRVPLREAPAAPEGRVTDGSHA
jgi:hypothetical protein